MRNVGSPPAESSPLNFLDHYFGSVYNKLEADALLFNQKLPHAGLAGAENENALASLLRDFLPPRFGLEVSGVVIDRFARQSRQVDIVIYDAWTFPKYLRKVFPVQVVHAVVEVKTTLSAAEAATSRENLRSVFDLEFRPALTPRWENDPPTRPAEPPVGVVFGFRSAATAFETFARWFPISTVRDGIELRSVNGTPEIRSAVIGCLDKGVLSMGSTNDHIERIVAIADRQIPRSMPATFRAKTLQIDPAKSLFLFLETLWQSLSDRVVHPAFDIRSYLSRTMNRIIKPTSSANAAMDTARQRERRNSSTPKTGAG